MIQSIKFLIKRHRFLLLIIIFGLLIRLIMTNLVYSFDAASFVIWAKYLTNHRIYELFEYLPDGYTPYPPNYYYILTLLGKIISYFNLWSNFKLTYILIKIPVYAADVIVAILIYWFSLKYLSKKEAKIALVFYYFHPAIIYNTSVWGQIDSIIILLGLLSLIMFFKQNYFLCLLIYLTDVLTKLQSLAILPLIGFITLIYLPIKRLIIYGVILMIVGLMPFIPIVLAKGLKWTWDYFFTIPNWYAYTSIYTYNLWAPFGFIITDNTKFLNLIEYKYLGIFLFWSVAVLILMPLRHKKNRKPLLYMFAAYLLWYNFSYFATRIHSRYLIYSFGFFAPFFTMFPQIGIFLSILMFANFLLPNKNELLIPLTTALNHPTIILIFVVYAFVLFLMSMKAYYELITNNNIRK